MEQWKTLKRETVFAALPYVEVVKEAVEIKPGVVVDDFYQVMLRSFSVCVPFLENGKVVVIRQYKHGPGKTCITFPAGFIEPNEPAATACERELLEETGYKAAKIIQIGSFVDNGNQRGCLGNYFLAQNCKYIQAPESGDLEAMEILLFDPDEIDEMVFDGSITITHHACAWLLAKKWLNQNNNIGV